MVKKLSIFWICILIFFSNIYSQSVDYELMCFYLEKTVKYTEWSSTSLDKDDFTIVVLDNEELGNTLTDYFSDKTLKNKNVKIVDIENNEDLPFCHICFIDNSSEKLIFNNNLEVLYVGYNQNIISDVIQINFRNTDKSFLDIEINLQNVKNSDIEISYLLYEIAKVYK